MRYLENMIKKYCLSQTDFSNICGISRRHINALIRGHHDPYPHTIKRLAMALSTLDGGDWLEHASNIRGEL